MPVFAWSAQARGFFAGHESESVDRVYDSADNRERRRRAGAVAARLGCTANQVAVAWVLRQPFPVYAVIGARTVAQLRESRRRVGDRARRDDDRGYSALARIAQGVTAPLMKSMISCVPAPGVKTSATPSSLSSGMS